MATEITALCEKQYGPSGDIHKFAVKLEGLKGTTTATTVVNVAENPFGEDMVILESYTCVTAVGTADPDMNIGLADSIAGANCGDECCDSLVYNVLGVNICQVATPSDRGVILPVWKAANAAHTAADSWIATYQTNTAAASDLRFNLTLVVCRKAIFA